MQGMQYLHFLRSKENYMATSKRGFASMDANKQREIASKGGRAAHAKGTAHEFTSDEARTAGRKGGEAVSQDRAHMSAIGREGGHSRGARARTPQAVRSDVEQTFERQVSTERSGFEPGNRNPERTLGSNRAERPGDTEQRDHGPFSGRERI
jgi:general stress protein YciG